MSVLQPLFKVGGTIKEEKLIIMLLSDMLVSVDIS